MLRHTYASHLVMAGTQIRVVQELLGHADLAMTMRYSHLSPDHKAAAVEVLVRGRRGRPRLRVVADDAPSGKRPARKPRKNSGS